MKAILPPAYLLSSLTLAVLLWAVAPGPRLIEFPWVLVGIVPVAIGASLNVVGDRQFRLGKTPIHPLDEPRSLVTSGLFRYLRHPMYLGMVLLGTGVAMLLGHTTPFAAPVLLWAVLRGCFVRHEEEALVRRFGTEYQSYRERVRRWM
jgi:protein-S-isoprenylcysteine O-methyltransferase Ste14